MSQPFHGVRNAEFDDPRLVPVYDAAFGWSRADDFFVSVVDETPAASVLDLGCGTGRLALGLAVAGHLVTGVDPAAASLRAARAKPGAEQVTWIEGTSAVLPDEAFDIALMTSHVAQFFVSDEAWPRVLADLAATLRFRTERAVRESLREAGFAVERIHGGWAREPVGMGDGELVVLARAEGRQVVPQSR